MVGGINADNARIFGGEGDAIYLAPLGTKLPETLDEELDPAFENVGWIHTDGIVESATGSEEKSRGHQGNAVVRTRINEPGTTIAFTALESKRLTKRIRYVEKESTVTDGVRKTRRSPGQRVTRMAAVVDLFDADDDNVQERMCIEVLSITPNGDRTHSNSDISGFPMSSEIIGDYDHLERDTEDSAEGGGDDSGN